MRQQSRWCHVKSSSFVNVLSVQCVLSSRLALIIGSNWLDNDI